MARTQTTSTTRTFARLDLLKIQVMTALRRSGVSESVASKVRLGLDKRYIAIVDVYGVDSAGMAWCHLRLTIDWRAHKLHIEAGRTTVQIDGRWIDNTAVEIDETLRVFEAYMASRPLTIKLFVEYAEGVDRNRADAELGFVPGTRPNWAGEPVGDSYNVRDLDELSIGIEMVD